MKVLDGYAVNRPRAERFSVTPAVVVRRRGEGSRRRTVPAVSAPPPPTPRERRRDGGAAAAAATDAGRAPAATAAGRPVDAARALLVRSGPSLPRRSSPRRRSGRVSDGRRQAVRRQSFTGHRDADRRHTSSPGSPREVAVSRILLTSLLAACNP